MCLILLSVAPDRVVVAANRDELRARPADPAAWWPEGDVFAGRDRQAGGTWLAVSRAGRFAAVTNVRSPAARRTGASRGALPLAIVRGPRGVGDEVRAITDAALAYASFNLVGAQRGRAFVSSDGAFAEVQAGVHGLSNASIDVAWPKVERGKARLRELVAAADLDREAVFASLGDRSVAPDAALPSTGVPLDLERILSSSFIVTPAYGTRCSTLVVLGPGGSVDFEERSFGADGLVTGVVRERW